MSMISGTAGSTSFFLKKSCLETKRFSRHAWQVNDVVRPKTVEGRKDLQSFSKHSRTPITRVTMRPVSGLAILSPNPFLQMKLTDDCAAGNTDHLRVQPEAAWYCGAYSGLRRIFSWRKIVFTQVSELHHVRAKSKVTLIPVLDNDGDK